MEKPPALSVKMDNANVIGICGYHKSGKTTLIVNLIQRLRKEGYRVATIKSIPEEFSIDREGKDTWRHADAGADAVVAASVNETAFILKHGMEIEQIVEILNRTVKPDLILVEGKKDEKWIPKIAVGEIDLEDAFRYDDNLDEVIEWIKATLKPFSDISSPSH
ncbi:molybdopterin-guanine dinucleotide biosynthesis protein B [Methanosarcinales archaeon]|nr:MAG: molybdopterin-guanine dinucleotide biosynthesis protein B [Methanosarcinales archaeon]